MYGGASRYFDARAKLSAYLTSGATKQPNQREGGKPSVSEPPSEPEDITCQASILYMSLPSRTTAMRQSPCPDTDCASVSILREDHTASKLPGSVLKEGIYLRRTHRDMYHTLRSNQACSAMQCLRLGVSGPEGMK